MGVLGLSDHTTEVQHVFWDAAIAACAPQKLSRRARAKYQPMGNGKDGYCYRCILYPRGIWVGHFAGHPADLPSALFAGETSKPRGNARRPRGLQRVGSKVEEAKCTTTALRSPWHRLNVPCSSLHAKFYIRPTSISSTWALYFRLITRWSSQALDLAIF